MLFFFFNIFPIQVYGDARLICQPTIIIWTKLVDLESIILYFKIQSQIFLGSREEDF